MRLTELVRVEGACSLPGCTLDYNRFVPVLQRAVKRGFIIPSIAHYTLRSLRFGYTGGAIRDQLERAGHREFRNYPSAVTARVAVTRALNKRIAHGKSLVLGEWSNSLRTSVSLLFAAWFIFPMGAVPKALELEEMRPTSDHTRSGFNSMCDLAGLRHSLDTYNEIAMGFLKGYFMHVSDVADAFPTLPVAPWVWPFLMCRFFTDDCSNRLSLIVHLFADFGGAGWPGEFKVFFCDVVVGMARSELILTLEMPIYVDDMGLMGPLARVLGAQMRSFQLFAMWLGLLFKWLKDRHAARRQLMIGFWWDSISRTRTLEERKLVQYMEMLLDFSTRTSLSLLERQRGIGRMIRIVMTLPAGAKCLMGEMLRLARGLKLPWQQRRTTRMERSDCLHMHKYLENTLGKGYFSYDQFEWAPDTRGDACKSHRSAGGGYASRCGRFYHCTYGASARRKPIVVLEGDQLVAQCQHLQHNWGHKLVPAGIDNQSFQFAQAKGWSHSLPVHDLLRILFELQLRGGYVLVSYWLNTFENDVADHFSRARIAQAIEAAFAQRYWEPGTVLKQHADSGGSRVVAAFAVTASFTTRSAAYRLGVIVRERASEVQRRQLDFMLAYPSAAFRLGMLCRLRLSMYQRNKLCRIMLGNGTYTSSKPNFHVSYPQASIWTNMPSADAVRTGEIMDGRLAEGSMGTVGTASKKWTTFAQDVLKCSPILTSGDPDRGMKMVRWGNSMADDTTLAWSSISNMFWGMRCWQKLQRQHDPVFGLTEWNDYCDALQVITHVTGEPRRILTVQCLEDELKACDKSNFVDVQFGLFILVQYFTFSRTECPCPTSWTGKGQFDSDQHWQVADFKIVNRDGVWVLAVRFKRIKQDQRILRPEALGEGDWVYVGDVPGTIFSVFDWYRLLMTFYPDGREQNAPMFMAKDRVRTYTYRCASDDHKRLIIACGRDPKVEGTLHGARVGGNDGVTTNHPKGAEMAQAHGGWKSAKAKARYDRFFVSRDVAPIPAYIVGVANPYLVVEKEPDPAPPEQVASPTPRLVGPRMPRKSAASSISNPFERFPRSPGAGTSSAPPAGSPSAAPPVSPLPTVVGITPSGDHSAMPHGWEMETLSCNNGKRSYKMYSLPLSDGTRKRADSIPDAWRIQNDLLQSKFKHLMPPPKKRSNELRGLAMS